ncbi:ABC transporter permease [Cutibacterium sp. WCA-380-WT-3A]|uniref:Oligopeptide transport system permease protein OppC n=1 Tax=Cutibacterium porci TaxID=2605781 RepID=A0A7K0J5K2_9ACTN|nr:ABC transporter permease [Cutibacterium porci]MSS45221.1 ABC transporter permease [Cutibacterium porci]
MSGTEPVGELGQLARFDAGPHLGEDIETDNIHGAEDFRPLNKHRIIARRFFRNKLAVAGLCVLVLVVFFAVAVMIFSPYRVDDLDPNVIGAEPPSSHHWLGTNQAGADVLTLLGHGTGLSLLIGVLVGVITPVIAVVYGTAMAYFGGIVDRVLLFLLETLIMAPAFLLIAIIMAGRSAGWPVLVLMLVIFGWMGTARVIRGMAMTLVNLDYVRSARYMGVSSPRIIWRHLVPNIASLTILNVTTGIWGAILAEVSYSYIGIGIKIPDTSLGLMIAQSSDAVSSYPWLFWTPVCMLALITGPLALINDGLRDAFDPSSHAGGHA